MKRIEKFFKPWLKNLSAIFRRDFSAVCGLYEEGEVCSFVLLTEEGERVSGTFRREDARSSFAVLLQEKGLKPGTVAGAVILPEITLLDSFEQQLGNLREKELRKAVIWSLRSRGTVMERPVWPAASPVSREDAPGGTYRIAAVSQTEGEKGAALLRSLCLEPLAVYIMERRKLPEYRIGVPDLQEKGEEKEPEPAEAAARFLWFALGNSISEGTDKATAEERSEMNFLPLEQRPELYRWNRVIGLMLMVWLALLTIFFLKGQQETGLAATLQKEETLLHRQAAAGEEIRRLIERERSVTALEAEAVRLSSERQPVSPTLEALGAFTPAGIRLTELKGNPEGVVEIKGRTKSRKLVDRFIETCRQEMEPGVLRLKNISGEETAPAGRVGEREFIIILGGRNGSNEPAGNKKGKPATAPVGAGGDGDQRRFLPVSGMAAPAGGAVGSGSPAGRDAKDSAGAGGLSTQSS